jgi:hypothetical protein
MSKRSDIEISFSSFFFTNRFFLRKIQASFPFPLLFKNKDESLEKLRKQINIYTVISYLLFGLLFFFKILIEG